MKKEHITSLGVPLIEQGAARAFLDLTNIRVFTGLSVVARMLGDEVIEQIQAGDSDVVVQRRVIGDITPELAAIGLSRVLIYARTPVLQNLRDFQDAFQEQIRTVFGTLQRPRWGSVLFPELFPELLPERSHGAARALLFPFHLHSDLEDIDYFFLVERHAELRFLRITIEPVQASRLDLARITHVVVDDLERRTYIQGLTRAAETFRLGLLRECEERRTEHSESDRRHPEFFDQLRRAGLTGCETISFSWPPQISAIISELPRPQAVEFLKRVLLALEDRQVTAMLQDGSTIEIKTDSARAFLDTSRLGRTLNVSFGQLRKHPDLDSYLQRMPILAKLSREQPQAFANTDIFLIHHITGEILAVLRALEAMGAERITVLFVRYAGVVPQEYLEVLLSQSRRRFSLYALNRIETTVRGQYLLSEQFSPTDDIEDLRNALHDDPADFFEAMRLAAGHLFLRAAARSATDGRRMLLLEDGGYLAPELHQACAAGSTLADVCSRYRLSQEGYDQAAGGRSVSWQRPFAQWLLPMLPGSVEHTRNGYDRLMRTAAETDALQFPSVSIAVSNIKRGEEAAEVAVTVLHAIESILHGMGLVLSRRKIVVLGSRGAIGERLMQALAGRGQTAWGVDIVADQPSQSTWGGREVAGPDSLEEEVVRECDLILGVIGHSILGPDWLERWVTGSRKPALFLASGSTKTLEFHQLSEWLHQIENGSVRLGGCAVELRRQPIRDAQTGLIMGTRVRLVCPQRTFPDLYLLADLTPINFLFYGVPTETMDAILTQLVQLGAGINGTHDLEPGIYALDREIDSDCRRIASGEAV